MAANVQLGSANRGEKVVFRAKHAEAKAESLPLSLSSLKIPQIYFWEDVSYEALDLMPWAPV